MNKTVIIESKNQKYANTYGGEIFSYDYCTEHPVNGISWAERIARAERFNLQCQRDAYKRDCFKKGEFINV